MIYSDQSKYLEALQEFQDVLLVDAKNHIAHF